MLVDYPTAEALHQPGSAIEKEHDLEDIESLPGSRALC
jgi:hypothetical protein